MYFKIFFSVLKNDLRYQLAFILFVLLSFAVNFSVNAQTDYECFRENTSVRCSDELDDSALELTLKGEIIVDVDGNAFLVTDSHEVFELLSEANDLYELNGLLVEAKGILLQYQVKPFYYPQIKVPFAPPMNLRRFIPSVLITEIKIL